MRWLVLPSPRRNDLRRHFPRHARPGAGAGASLTRPQPRVGLHPVGDPGRLGGEVVGHLVRAA